MDKSRQLYDLMVRKGYQKEFAAVIASEMRTEYTSMRMIGYIAANPLLPMETVADEMLATQSDRDRIADKHISEHAQSKINEFYREHNE